MSGPRAAESLRIGISACLTGERVRYDGGHKLDRFLVETFGRAVEFVPVCPETGIGLPVPRDTLRIERRAAGPALVTARTGRDHTAAMRRFGRTQAASLEKAGAAGFILKKGSPSCGLAGVPVRGPGGRVSRAGRGLFAAALTERLPLLPVEEEGRLADPVWRDNFITRICAYRRLRRFFTGRWTVTGLAAFHARERLLLMAHDRPAHQRLERQLAGAGTEGRGELRAAYSRALLDALGRKATARKHARVMWHVAGCLKKVLGCGDRAELAEAVEGFQAGRVPRLVPLTLLRYWVRVHRVEALAGQSYLEPHPAELMLCSSC